jgi:hypothetical protein
VSTSVLGLDSATYAPHALHDPARPWQETNCYVDLWIEALHGLGLEPTAALPFTLGLDFEGDQYTFYKFPLPDLQFLYGIEVQELNIWRPLVTHAEEQVAMGRLFMPEVDSWFLPDTQGVSYRREHVKSSIAVQHIDTVARVLGYFHGPGYHTLSGEDFAGVFRMEADLRGPATLPPFAEIAKLGGLVHHTPVELVRRSLTLLRHHLANRPRQSPVRAHRDKLEADIAWLRDEPIDIFHQYAFATVRQLGSCYGLTATYLHWLEANGETGLTTAIEACDSIAATSKTLQFKLARVVTYRKDADLAELFDRLESSWDLVMAELGQRYGA